MWTTRRIKLAIAGTVLLSAGLVVGFVVGRAASGGAAEEKKKVAEVPVVAPVAAVSEPQWQTPPPPVSAGTVAAQQMSPPTYIEMQPVQQPGVVYVQAATPMAPPAPVMEQQPQEDYWSDRPVGRNGLIGNPSADPPSCHGRAYSRAY